MYDELIKRLRDAAHWADKGLVITPNVCLEAADAIEELRAENESLAKSVNEASEILRKRWTPVTERLPDKDGRYLVSYPLFNIEAWMRVAYFSTDLHRMDGYAFPGKQYKRPGFYYSDDEYGDVELKDVTHWMPLPEPPKEET